MLCLLIKLHLLYYIKSFVSKYVVSIIYDIYFSFADAVTRFLQKIMEVVPSPYEEPDFG